VKTNIFYKKIKAGALQYTIFISVIIALLVFAFISLSFVQQKVRIKTTFFQEVVEATNQGFSYLAYHKIPYNQQALLPLQLDTRVKTTTNKTQWGLFDITSITSKKGKETFTKTALVGSSNLQRPALYLQDQNQPLVLVGITRIEGATYLPKQGVKRGTIAGHSYTGTQLIYGSITNSTAKPTQLQGLLSLRKFPSEIVSKEENIFISLEENTRLVNSFSKPTKIISSTNTITLQVVELIGNIVIHSDTKIKVHATASLKDVILIAPQIEILEKVSGNFQAFATKNITVHKNTNLSYPTALILLEKKNQQQRVSNTNQENNQIHIQKNSTVKGIIAFITDNKIDNYKPQILLEENTIVTGEVYNNQNTELKGTVKGSIYTKQFIANEFGSVYKNHIYNGKILGNDLPQHYSGLSFKKTHSTIAKWLYY